MMALKFIDDKLKQKPVPIKGAKMTITGFKNVTRRYL